MDTEESESNNRHKVKTTASPTDLVLHYDKKMIFYICYIYLYICIYAHTFRHKQIHTYTNFLSS